tara:strand:- start:129 stop:1061 length:933 start_codon:yes stop_codon:yes gene_type:complete
MRVLITGGSGLIGGRLAKYLKKKRLKIVIASRKRRFFQGSKFKKINWNSYKNLEKLCQNIDVIINCAGYDFYKSKNKSETFSVNSKKAQKLFKAAQTAGVNYFIFLSSAHVYKDNLVGFINEKTRPKTSSIYGLSKLDGERKLRKTKKRTKLLILRPSNLFGYPNNQKVKCWHLLINSIIKDLVLHKKTVIFSKKNVYRNYSSIENFCNFVFFIIKKFIIKKKKLPQVINFCSEYNLSLLDVVSIIKKRFKAFKNNKKIKIKFKNINLIKTKKLLYKSIYSRKFKFQNDKYFIKELNNIILYCYSNFAKN